jgi:multiple antibiotic resistance protein
MSAVLDPVKTFVSLLALVDPLAAVPMFIALTAQFTAADKAKVARTAALAVPCIIAVSALLGGQIIENMGISMGGFKIGGGIILLLMALQMMNANTAGGTTRSTPAEQQEAAHKSEQHLSIAVVPLALPVLVGPGSISTVIIYAGKAKNVLDYGAIIGSGIIIGVLTWLAFRAAPRIAAFMGVTGINIATRVMGLLLAALGAEFIVDGLVMMIPALQK